MSKTKKTIISIGIAILVSILFHIISWLWFYLNLNIVYVNTLYQLSVIMSIPLLYMVYGLIHFFILRPKMNFSYTITFSVVSLLISAFHYYIMFDKKPVYSELVHKPIVNTLFSNIDYDIAYFLWVGFFFFLAIVVCSAVVFVVDMILTIIKNQNNLRIVLNQVKENM